MTPDETDKDLNVYSVRSKGRVVFDGNSIVATLFEVNQEVGSSNPAPSRLRCNEYIYCRWKDGTVTEKTGHPSPSCVHATKMRSLAE